MKHLLRKYKLYALVLFTAVLAYIGFYNYFIQTGEVTTFFDITYYVLKLFMFESNIDNEFINLSLNISRFLAPASLATVIIGEILNLFSYKLKKGRARRFEDHIIFCGNSRNLNPLMAEQTAQKDSCILIHRDEDMLKGGRMILKLPYDEFTEDIMDDISFYDSKYVIISNQNDLHSIDYATSLVQSIDMNLLKKNIEIVLIFNNPEWSEASNDLGLLESLNRQILEHKHLNIRYINYIDRGVRKLLHICPPDHYKPVLSPKDELPTVLITGFNELSKRLIIGLALNCHYLNPQKLKVYIHSDRDKDMAEFIAKYQLEHMLDLDYSGEEALEDFIHKIDVSYLCDVDSIELFGNLARMSRNSLLQSSHKIVCRDEGIQKAHLSKMVDHVFVGREETNTLSALIDASIDEMAMTIHMNYIQSQEDKNERSEELDTHKEWEKLSDEAKDRNRYPADHMLTKARSMNCKACDINSPDKAFEVESFIYLDDLSEAEHRRWSAYMYFKGWRKGPERINEAKIHPDLIPYEKLKDPAKLKDRNNILQLQELFALKDLKLVEIQNEG